MPVLRSSSAYARSLHRLCDSCMAQRNLGRSRSFSSPRAPATLHFDASVSVSQHLQAWFDIGSQPVRLSTRGRSSARLRLSGPPGGPPPRSRLLGRSSKGVAKPYQCVERSYGHCCARMEQCKATVAAAWLQLPLLRQGQITAREQMGAVSPTPLSPESRPRCSIPTSTRAGTSLCRFACSTRQHRRAAAEPLSPAGADR
jgi:hypothetical protein